MDQSSGSDYYSRRADEYEAVYAKPERQEDLERLRVLISHELSGFRVLELGCGTGYWTQVIARAAEFVTAIDRSAEVLQVARRKAYPHGKVRFQEADAFELVPAPGEYTAVFGGFFWSHVPRQRLPVFLAGLNASVGSGVKVMFVDNRFVPGSSTPISGEDVHGNTYQVRRLSDGSEHEIVKNFPAPGELGAVIEPYGDCLRVTDLPYYWVSSYVSRDA